MPRVVPPGSKSLLLDVGDTASKRPYHAAHGMSAVSRFSDVEFGVKSLYLSMLGSNPGPAAATFSVLRNSRAQEDALFAVAEDLDADGKNYLTAFWKVYKSVGKRRDQLAHHIWAVEEQFPNDVALAEPNMMSKFEIAHKNLRQDGIKRIEEVESVQKILTEAVRLWSLDDFKCLDADCRHTNYLAIIVREAISRESSDSDRQKARDILGAARLIRDFLPQRLQTDPAKREASWPRSTFFGS